MYIKGLKRLINLIMLHFWSIPRKLNYWWSVIDSNSVSFCGETHKTGARQKKENQDTIPSLTPFLSADHMQNSPPRACLSSPLLADPGLKRTKELCFISFTHKNYTFGHKLHVAPSSAPGCYKIKQLSQTVLSLHKFKKAELLLIIG